MIQKLRFVRIIVFFSLIQISPFASVAQSFNATYYYDANGNRIKASVVYLSQSDSSPAIEDNFEIEPNTTTTIKLFPNPTKGDLILEIGNAIPLMLNSVENYIKVWDMQGNNIISINPISSSNTINLLNYSNGIYILTLHFNGETKNYKIVKN